MPTSLEESIPEIDLSQDETKVIEELLTAFTSIGFATLINHGVEHAKIQKAFSASKQLFQLDSNAKTKYAFQGHESNRGYIPMGSETHDLTEEKCSPDRKETLTLEKRMNLDFRTSGLKNSSLRHFERICWTTTIQWTSFTCVS